MSTKDTTIRSINIKEIFTAKSPGTARMIPGFVYKWIHNLLRLDFINGILQKYGHLQGIEFAKKMIDVFNITEHVHGLENIPKEGKYIFASNHPLGGFDAFLLMKNVHEKLGDFKFLVNDILMNIPQLRSVFVPVNKYGTQKETARMLSGIYNSDCQILIFPFGLASRKLKGKVMDLEWKKHFISKSIRHKRDVIPVFISGHNTQRFYRVAKLRKFFRIKWNLETFLLPDETYRHQNADIHIYFGKPIPYTTFTKEKTHQEWANWTKKQAYTLPEEAY